MYHTARLTPELTATHCPLAVLGHPFVGHSSPSTTLTPTPSHPVLQHSNELTGPGIGRGLEYSAELSCACGPGV
jgi:hypothetical protein